MWSAGIHRRFAPPASGTAPRQSVGKAHTVQTLRAVCRGFDVVLAEAGSVLYKAYIEFFERVREAPHLRKGMVRLLL